MSHKKFFDEKQAAAIFKHALLDEYFAPFVGKVGSTSLGGRVTLLDGYSGPGKYADDAPGSPALMVQTAENMSAFRDVQCIFVERDLGTHRALSRNLGSSSRVWVPPAGPIEEHLDAALERAKELTVQVKSVDQVKRKDSSLTPTHCRVPTMAAPRMTFQLAQVLAALLDRPLEPTYGLEIVRSAGLSSGTTYPILARLEREGWVESRWEEIDPAKAGRRPRRYYQLTGEGARRATEVLAEFGALVRPTPAGDLRSAPGW